MFTIDYASGVYLREEDRSIRVEGATTSIGAAVFAALKGPVNKVRPITSDQERFEVYGPHDPTVSLATYGVTEMLKATNNMYCVRVAVDALYGGVIVSRAATNQKVGAVAAASPATSSTGTLTNGSYSYRIVTVDEAGKTTPGAAATATVVSSPTAATLTTSLAGANNNLRYAAVTAGVIGNSNTIAYVDPSANNAALSVVITNNSTYITVVVNLATNGSGTITSTANDILVALQAQGTAFSNYLTVAFAPSNNGTGVVTALAATPLAGGAATGSNDGVVNLSWTAVTGATGYEVYGRTSGSELLMATITNPATLTYQDTGAITPAGALPVANTSSDMAIKPFTLGQSDPATTLTLGTDDLFAVYAIDPGTWNQTLRVAITKINTTDNTFRIALFNPGQTQPFEQWDVSRTKQLDGYGRQMYLEERINPVSSTIRVLNNTTNVQNPSYVYTTPIAMAGGTNGTTPTLADIAAAWNLFADPEEIPIRIMLNGGYADPVVHRAMDTIAQTRRDCVAILDTPSDQQDYISAVAYRNTVLNLDSTWSALYTSDQVIVDQDTDTTLFVPPSGFVGRALARADRLYGPGWAAAGMERGDVSSLGSRYFYNQGQRNLMSENQVNYIRTFRGGRGFKIWEQFTCTQKPQATQLLSVRMLLIFINASVNDFLLYHVFDPNDAITRRRIKSRIEQFLDLLVSSRGLYRYKVVCDDTNNKPQNIDEGILLVDGYLEPTIPARRILFTTIVTATGASTKEATIAASGSV